jgi:hypothetical protein
LRILKRNTETDIWKGTSFIARLQKILFPNSMRGAGINADALFYPSHEGNLISDTITDYERAQLAQGIFAIQRSINEGADVASKMATYESDIQQFINGATSKTFAELKSELEVLTYQWTPPNQNNLPAGPFYPKSVAASPSNNLLAAAAEGAFFGGLSAFVTHQTYDYFKLNNRASAEYEKAFAALTLSAAVHYVYQKKLTLSLNDLMTLSTALASILATQTCCNHFSDKKNSPHESGE